MLLINCSFKNLFVLLLVINQRFGIAVRASKAEKSAGSEDAAQQAKQEGPRGLITPIHRALAAHKDTIQSPKQSISPLFFLR